MTQTAQPATAAPPTGAVLAPPAPGAATTPATYTEDVPKLLNRWQVLAVAACVAFAVLSTVVQLLAYQANGRAADNTEQVVRVQKIQSSLLRADALATNAFLVGGLEPADARAAYESAINDVLRLVTDAADAQPADRAVLADLNVAVRTYTTAVAQARDYNRQNLVIGIAYLNQASTSLRADALPIVKALVDANSARAGDEMDAQHPFWLLGLGALAVVVLWWVNRSIAQRFRRRVNVGVAGAAALVVVLTLLASVHASSRNSDNAETRAGPYAGAVNEASARTAANDAKAQESQGLINRGSGPAYEVKWQAAADVVSKSASPATLRLWNEYVAAHQAIRAQDDDGQWDAARGLATSTDPAGATALLTEVDSSAERVVTTSADEATSAFRSGGFTSLALIVLTLLGGLVAAAASTWGVNQRRREYS
ncbi:hypothetical protein BH11ACT8_BH11ACT8_26180 [soil metagenome]